MSRLERKVDFQWARVATIHVPAENTAVDGFLPEEERELVIAKGRGKFEGRIMVQIGFVKKAKGSAPQGFIYRPGTEYEALRQGRDLFVDPEALRNGEVVIFSEESNMRGLWVPVEKLGTLK